MKGKVWKYRDKGKVHTFSETSLVDKGTDKGLTLRVRGEVSPGSN